MTERERRPTSRDWAELPVPRVITLHNQPIAASFWARGTVRVMSELANVELPGSGGAVGPTWHVSVSRLGKRPKRRDVDHALTDFGMRGAEEDNHHPGGARHFFLPVDPAFRGVCECKTTEDVIVEPDGYRWTNPKAHAVEGCRGCAFARAFGGKPCPIHGWTNPKANAVDRGAP